MRKVCRLAREVLDIAAAAVKPGVTTDYIDEIVHKACIERDVTAPFLYGITRLLTIPVVPLTTELWPLS
jgi:methionine aminopeptidase